MGKDKAIKKNKGPKGKKARAKAKLERQWGETAIVDDEKTVRRGRKLLQKKNVDDADNKSKLVSFAPDKHLHQRRDHQQKSHTNTSDFRETGDIFSDSEDSDGEPNVVLGLLSSIHKSKKKRKRRSKDSLKEFHVIEEEKSDTLIKNPSKDLEMEERSDADSIASETSSEGDLSSSDDEETGSTVDFFQQRFGRPPLTKSQVESLEVPSVCKISLSQHVELHASNDAAIAIVGTKEKSVTQVDWSALAKEAFKGNRKLLKKRWKHQHKRKMTDRQAPIYKCLTSYCDLLVTTESMKDRDKMHDIYTLHALNHVLTSRGRIQRHNKVVKAKEAEEREEDNESMKTDLVDPDQLRDQGFTRPTVLVLLPTRATCHGFIRNLLQMTGCSLEPEIEERLDGEYGPIENEEEERDDHGAEQRRKMVLENKGVEWNELFGDCVNQDDDFKVGLSITPKAVKKKNGKNGEDDSASIAVRLYTDFFKSDFIIASPLGLKMLLMPQDDDDRVNADYLSSIEICLLMHGDVLMMQNWDHVNDVLGALNREPENNNNTDFSRVRNYFLENKASSWRQLIVSSSISDPQLQSTFKRFAKSMSGSVRMRRKVPADDAAITSVITPIKQVFQKVLCGSFDKQSDARVNYFVKHLLPNILRQKQYHTLVYIPSYFDFVSLRNILLKREVSFVSVTEYSRNTEVTRGRARFLQGRKPIMLFTGRCNFFQRHAIKGVQNLIFLGLPEHPDFYPNQVNQIESAGESGMSSCLALCTKYEMHALDRIVGSLNCNRMLRSDKTTFLFCT